MSPTPAEIQETLDILLPLRQRIATMRSPYDRLGSITELECRAIERLALFVIESLAALERPRPAPPDTLESVTAWLDSFDWWDENTKGMARAILKRYGGGPAETGAAPLDALIQAAEEAANVLAALATRVKWGRIGNVSRSEEDHWRKLAGDIRELVRGGAAQPPPSAPDRCVMCGKIPDSIVSSRNPALTVCRNCWVGVPREETNHE